MARGLAGFRIQLVVKVVFLQSDQVVVVGVFTFISSRIGRPGSGFDVGQQLTLGNTYNQSDLDRLVLMETRATVAGAFSRSPHAECDLTVRADINGTVTGLLYSVEESQYIASDETRYSRDQLLSASNSATFLCLDRDMDGYFDAVELTEGSDPADAGSTPDESWWHRIVKRWFS